MALREIDKAHIRRHLKFSMIGKAFQGELGNSIFGTRTTPLYFDLETRMNTMSPSEEAILTGKAYAAISIWEPVPVGSVLTATFSGGPLSSPVVIPVTAGAGDNAVSFCQRLTAAFAGNSSMISAAFQSMAPWGAGQYTNNAVPNPEMAITNEQTFTLALAVTGGLICALTADGKKQDPTVVVKKRPLTQVFGYLPICNFLEGAIGGATTNMEFNKAESVIFRNDEAEGRTALYDQYVQRMAEFLGVFVNDPGEGYGRACI